MSAAKRTLPPCPDPDNYILVRTKEGSFWRRKRGTVKNAPVNKVLAKNNRAYKILMPAVSRMLTMLKPYTAELSMGRVTARWTGKLLKPFIETGKICYSALEKSDLQPVHPFDSLCHLSLEIMTQKQLLNIRLFTAKTIIKLKNFLVTDYFFDAVLLYGDAKKENGLNVCSARSPVYKYTKKPAVDCSLQLPMPAVRVPWLLLLKISSLEGDVPAASSRHYGMMVVKGEDG